MNVLSLFDGMSCGQIALQKANINVNKYFSSEIDQYAIQITQAHYPNTIQLGDITKWRDWDIDLGTIDLILAGFPCQAWSIAGKQKGSDDLRGKLVHDLLDIWEEIKKVNPNVKFLFENVKMKKEFLDYINNLFGVKPILINSALVSAQQRKRYYWTNIGNITQPENKHIYLKNVIESEFTDSDKSYTIDNNYAKGGDLEQYFIKKRRQLFFNQNLKLLIPFNETFYDGNFQKWLKKKNIQFLINKKYVIDVNETICPSRANKYRLSHIKGLNDKSRCLTTSCGSIQNAGGTGIYRNGVYRKLLPVECERLQTVPENYTKYVSNTQRYKMLGNGWTVDIITHILSFIVKD